ncbi:hypothetical protein LCGC14_0358850 [marine sediment metagenome]|uniref:Uncharacterized protein n=1 Tax=marine sediment metagenome TaxID=412755 RepID=A0A0F9T8R4_9ZZZZ
MNEVRELLEKIAENIYQASEGSCPLCHEKDYPVCGGKKGYDEVNAEDAEHWALDHADTCPVTLLDQAIAKLDEKCVWTWYIKDGQYCFASGCGEAWKLSKWLYDMSKKHWKACPFCDKAIEEVA